MSWFASYVRSSIGAKHVMAVTGLLMFLFALVHMLGHLQMFGGPEMYNRYAHFLQELWEVKWPARVGLLVLLIVHAVTAIGLVSKNRAARPIGYARYKPVVSSPVGRAMAWTGLFVFAFIAFHILHFTLGQVQPGYFHVMDPKERWDAYAMYIHGFQNPAIYGVYLVGIALLAMHLGHGAASWLQSLGLRHPKYPTDRLGPALGVLLFVGYMLPPTAVVLGALTLSDHEMTLKLDPRTPGGPIEQQWSNARFEMKLVNPANKRKYKVIVVGSGLAGGAAAATLAELGYDVACFCFQDSPRRAHSIAAQGGINAAKNYQNDGDSVHRLFYDTVKGGDFRARESNVHRLAEVSVDIIDQCAAMGVPFAREYGGVLANRSFGGAQVSRTFYARGQTGQQLLLGVYAALSRQIGTGKVTMFPRTEMLDVVVDAATGRATGIVVRDLITGAITSHAAHAVILATGGYGNAFYLSTNAKGCNVTATYRAYKRGAGFANPCFTQIHPTCIPVSGDYQSKLTLMSESLRNDGRVWVPKSTADIAKHPDQIADSARDYYLERKYPSYGNLSPRDIASRAAKEQCDEGRGVGPGGRGVYLDFRDAIQRDGEDKVRERYGNLFDMYERITGENPYRVPMRIYPAVHYTMGGLWVDYQLQTTIPGLFCLGEANFSDHGANRLGASALMQGLADGYFIIPYTLGNYLAGVAAKDLADPAGPAFRAAETGVRARLDQLLAVRGSRSVDSFHKELGHLMWEHCGMARSRESLTAALARIPALREEFWRDVTVLGGNDSFNQTLEKAGRVADFLEFAELMCQDALVREESCGGHFRVEHQVDGEAKRDDEKFCHAAVWEYAGEARAPVRNIEPLAFENVKLATRSYK